MLQQPDFNDRMAAREIAALIAGKSDIRAKERARCIKVCQDLSDQWPLAQNHFDMCIKAISELKDDEKTIP